MEARLPRSTASRNSGRCAANAKHTSRELGSFQRFFLFEHFRSFQLHYPCSIVPMTFAQALTALRAHASQHGHVDTGDPDQLLRSDDNDLPRPASPNRSSNSSPLSPLRRRIRRDEENRQEGFGPPHSTVSSGDVQSNTGLGAALLSIFNDIVADNSNRGSQSAILNPSLPQPQHQPRCTGDHPQNDVDMTPESNVDVEVFSEMSSASPGYDELTQFMGAEVDFETPHRSEGSHDSFHDIEVRQDVPVSIIIAPPENHGGVTPRRVKQQLQQSAVQVHDVIAPPIHGGITPRRMKNTGPIGRYSQEVVSPISARHQEACPGSEQEMDM